jgi:CRP/FNR family transcriptional regulator, cyclic AMP receptor protein
MNQPSSRSHDRPWPKGTLLARLPPRVRDEILALGTPRRYPPDHTLLNQGDRGDFVYLLLDALVKVVARAENGTESLLGIRVSGDIVGEMAVLEDTVRSVTVVTCRPAVASRIAGPAFGRFVEKHSVVGLSLTRMTGDRLRWANERRLDTAAYEVDVRLARLLLQLAERHGERRADDLHLGLPLTQAELGALISAKEVTVQKSLRLLEGLHLVRRGRRTVIITDHTGLREFAGLGRPPLPGKAI